MRHKMGQMALCLAVLFSIPAAVKADEGMWTFDAFPAARVAAQHGVKIDQAWLDRVQKAAVRLSVGCSSSLVSPNGLVLTNWHCLTACAQDLSTKTNNLAENGFVAATQAEERTCPNTQAEILLSIRDVTPRIRAALSGKPMAEVAKARTAEIARIEDEGCKADPKTKCEVVTLYQGGEYKLYTYRKYEDVRLVFEPEQGTGFFGGDPDNFNFPRFNLDSGFVRLYENGKPAVTPNYLPWSAEAPQENDVVFVAGNPGTTSRLFTVAQLGFQRDWRLPTRQLIRAELRGRLLAFSSLSAENKRQAQDIVFSVENSFKAQYGEQRALLEPAFFGVKVEEERKLREGLQAKPELAAKLGDPWADIEAAVAEQRNQFLAHDFLEERAGSVSSLYLMARQLVRAAEERSKPSAERLPGFSDSALPELERRLRENTPVFPGVERIGLELWLSKTREFLTVDDARVQRLLGKESPEGLAQRAIAGTRLADPKVRMALWTGGKAAVDASTDPLIVLARRAEPDSRAALLNWREKVEGPIALAQDRIAQARFALLGTSVYPDATFTLRLSYGTVKGWSHLGRTVPPFTSLGGAYERATGADPFILPKRWVAAEGKVDKTIRFNLSSTNDIVGGNSGSPLIDVRGRVVGAAFDGNIHSLGGAYGFDPELNRTVSVTTVAITEALNKIYGATRIADELKAGAR
ncbi:MAG: S46 family peptidase [Bryobacterales bacterium]|nr:S46 family peptidase [Bryobacterales bacterium]